MVCDTPPSQDVSTYQIWNPFFKESRRYALDTKRDGRTVQLLYASQSSFGGIKRKIQTFHSNSLFVSSRRAKWYRYHFVASFVKSKKSSFLKENIKIVFDFFCLIKEGKLICIRFSMNSSWRASGMSTTSISTS